MRKTILYLLFSIIFLNHATAQENTVLSAQVYGYKGDMVYFDCVQTPLVRQEFYTNPGEEHIYNFTIDQNVCMLINGKNRLLLQPGDSLHVDLYYEGKNVRMELSGDDEAVKNNSVLMEIEDIKREMRYKSQLLACAALDIKPKDRINDSRIFLEKVKNLLNERAIGKEISDYLLSGIESEVYLSFMEYPVMYASVRGVAVEKQEIGDYNSIMNGVELRSDESSLSNPEYASFLMRYCFYSNETAAKEKGTAYNIPNKFEDMYSELANFYDGAQRDFVLYTLLCNFIKNGQDIDRADALYKDYTTKYNKNKRYITVLDAILQ